MNRLLLLLLVLCLLAAVLVLDIVSPVEAKKRKKKPKKKKAKKTPATHSPTPAPATSHPVTHSPSVPTSSPIQPPCFSFFELSVTNWVINAAGNTFTRVHSGDGVTINVEGGSLTGHGLSSGYQFHLSLDKSPSAAQLVLIVIGSDNHYFYYTANTGLLKEVDGDSGLPIHTISAATFGQGDTMTISLNNGQITFYKNLSPVHSFDGTNSLNTYTFQFDIQNLADAAPGKASTAQQYSCWVSNP